MSLSALRLDSDALDFASTDAALHVVLAGGCERSAPLEWVPRPHDATPESRGNWRRIGGGQAIHWPDLDEDISVATRLRSN